ncbi:MAG: hypothetical protein U0470_02820 [Anaerolineae bacterium]
MSLAKILAALAVLCTGLALAAWLVLTVVVGGALVGFGGPPRVADRAATAAARSFATTDAGHAAAAATNASGHGTDAPATSRASAAPTARASARAGRAGRREDVGRAVGRRRDHRRRRRRRPRDRRRHRHRRRAPPGTDGVRPGRRLADDPDARRLDAGHDDVPLQRLRRRPGRPRPDRRRGALVAAPRGHPGLRRGRLGRDMPVRPIGIVFSRGYEAACPARGLAAPTDDERKTPLIMVFIGPDTSDLQIRAVLAHEMAHHIAMDDAFVGDGVLTEGIANWAAGAYALAWQGFGSWDDAARRYLAEGDYVSVADPSGLRAAARRAVPGAPRPRVQRPHRVRRLADRPLRPGHRARDAQDDRPRRRPAGRRGDAEERTVPDYAAATGDSLTQLERRWLADLGAAAPR